jgi:hypothetical protein
LKVVFHLDDFRYFGDRLAFLLHNLSSFVRHPFLRNKILSILFDLLHLGPQYILQQLDKCNFLIDFFLLLLLVEGIFP